MRIGVYFKDGKQAKKEITFAEILHAGAIYA
jgi:hypothetical protein